MEDDVTHDRRLPLAVDDEGALRILDSVLVERRGHERPRKVRDLIKRHRPALVGLGNGSGRTAELSGDAPPPLSIITIIIKPTARPRALGDTL